MADSRETWYEARKGDAHKAVFQQIDYIRRQQEEMREGWLECMEMYAAGDVTGLGASNATSRYYAVELQEGPSVRFNLAAAGVDTAASLISQAPVVPQYLTTDGNFKLIRQAEKCSQILQGQFDRDVQETLKRAALDSMKVGTGFVFQQFDPITGLPGLVRVHALEVFVEHLDGMHMRPRSLHRTRFVPKETLSAQFPKFATAIRASQGVARSNQNNVLLAGLGQHVNFDDMVEVSESWHLRPTSKAKGRHTMCVPGVTLLDEGYDHDEFPCAVFRYRERDLGYYGAGLIESCVPAQNRINDLIRRNARAQDLGSNLIILNPNGENAVSKETFTNDLGLIINYEPLIGPPQLVKWEGTLNDLQNQVDVEVSRWLMTEGISSEQTNGQGAGKGLDSGVAVRAADDVQSRRLVPYTSRFQTSCMHAARLFERMNDDCAKKNPSFSVTAEGSSVRRTFLKTARWLEVRPPKGDARLTMAQMSALPTTPQGRWAAVQEWVQAGFASRQYAMALLQFPDLDAYATTELAHIDYARWQIDQILDEQDPMPDPRQDLELAIDLAVKSKLKAATMGADEDVLERFEAFIVYCEELQDQAAAQEQAAAAPASNAPIDPGLGMPVSPRGVVAPSLRAMA